jgi:signal transduction histidine kinase
MREQRRTPEDYERAMDDLADVNERMRALVERLLQASRAESPVQLVKELVNLSELLNDLGETMQPIAQQRDLALSTQCASGLYVLGDIDALLRLFINLIDNALKYTDAGFVQVTAQARQGLVQVEVSDSGRGIAPEDLPHIFDRFYRADPSRSATGFGLGLTIVQDIVRRHNGKMNVTSEVGRGTTFAVALPQAA